MEAIFFIIVIIAIGSAYEKWVNPSPKPWNGETEEYCSCRKGACNCSWTE